MTPYLPFDAVSEEPRPKIRRNVRAVSRAQYADGRERFEGRKGHVLRWLAAYFNGRQEYPTSGELAYWAQGYEHGFDDSWLSVLLYVRRGLSDLQTVGVVEAIPQGQRTCKVSGRKCETWRVKSR